MEKISNKIKVIGFIMTCFMVLYHCKDYDDSLAINSADLWINTEINHFFSIMGAVVMAWFFTVTGFLLMHGLAFSNYLKKIKRRCFSLLIPYVLWQVIIALHNMVLFHARYSIKHFLYQNFALIRWPFNGALWYVYAVFLLAILSPILLIVFKNKKTGLIILICIISFIQYRGNVTNTLFQKVINYGYIPNVLTYLPAYLLGSFYGYFFDELNSADSLKYALLLLFISRLLFFVNFSSATLFVLPMFGIFLIPNITVKFSNLNIYKLTFLIYALHQPLIVDFRKYILWALGLVIHYATFMNLFGRLLILIIDIILSAVIYIVLKKTCPLLLKFLTGGRI